MNTKAIAQSIVNTAKDQLNLLGLEVSPSRQNRQEKG